MIMLKIKIILIFLLTSLFVQGQFSSPRKLLFIQQEPVEEKCTFADAKPTGNEYLIARYGYYYDEFGAQRLLPSSYEILNFDIDYENNEVYFLKKHMNQNLTSVFEKYKLNPYSSELLSFIEEENFKINIFGCKFEDNFQNFLVFESSPPIPQTLTRYKLNTAKDIKSGFTKLGAYSSIQRTAYNSVFASPDGQYLYENPSTSSSIIQYKLNNDYTSSVFYSGSIENSLARFYFHSPNKLYAAQGWAFYEYNLVSPYDISNIELISHYYDSYHNNTHGTTRDLSVSNDETRMYKLTSKDIDSVGFYSYREFYLVEYDLTCGKGNPECYLDNVGYTGNNHTLSSDSISYIFHIDNAKNKAYSAIYKEYTGGLHQSGYIKQYNINKGSVNLLEYDNVKFQVYPEPLNAFYVNNEKDLFVESKANLHGSGEATIITRYKFSQSGNLKASYIQDSIQLNPNQRLIGVTPNGEMFITRDESTTNVYTYHVAANIASSAKDPYVTQNFITNYSFIDSDRAFELNFGAIINEMITPTSFMPQKDDAYKINSSSTVIPDYFPARNLIADNISNRVYLTNRDGGYSIFREYDMICGEKIDDEDFECKVPLILNESSKIFNVAHGTTTDGSYIYVGERALSGQTPKIYKIDLSLNLVSSLSMGSDVESLIYDSKNNRLYATQRADVGGAYTMRIVSINPITMSVINTKTYTGITTGLSFPIVTDGNYIYGATYSVTNPTLFKIRTSDLELVIASTWYNAERPHAARIDIESGYMYLTDIPVSAVFSDPSHFARVSLTDLSYMEITISNYAVKPTDDFAMLKIGGETYCYIGGEYRSPSGWNENYGGVRVKVSDLTQTGINLKPTFSVWEHKGYIYSTSMDGDLEIFHSSDIENKIVCPAGGSRIFNEVIAVGGRLFVTDYVNGKISEIEPY